MTISFKSNVTIQDGAFISHQFDAADKNTRLKLHHTPWYVGSEYALSLINSDDAIHTSEFILEENSNDDYYEHYNQLRADVWIKDKENAKKICTVLEYAKNNDDPDFNIELNDDGSIFEIKDDRGNKITINGDKLNIKG